MFGFCVSATATSLDVSDASARTYLPDFHSGSAHCALSPSIALACPACEARRSPRVAPGLRRLQEMDDSAWYCREEIGAFGAVGPRAGSHRDPSTDGGIPMNAHSAEVLSVHRQPPTANRGPSGRCTRALWAAPPACCWLWPARPSSSMA